ncbi:isoprenylcysteine carboxylmethyltransferase family protein [Oricola thermophila]|uniref:Isoprenylcysteine carboxylmethyltransferase family protein n=2 Tax=Oricola thermophila TaxID=2742145 RepID=A0A6N1VEN0_9HYPH|nr:isoprenylcysteine carboxylmethyltransferase family protein [Oricola thermophila]QKV18085.1 isoprenylcysteine carboxylmethyltransferase family protein [Oricola thermophila]
MATEHDGFSDRPNRLPWPPIIYAAALLAGWPLGHFLETPWIGGMTGEVLFAAGILTIVGALAIDIAAMNTMRRKRTTILPNRKADHLVTNGVFAVSRNPIYLANTMLVIGAGLISGIVWYFPLALIAAYMTQKLAIEREEKHLESRFGKLYRDYRKRVNRWI